MTMPVEDELRELFAEDGERAPVVKALADKARRRGRRIRLARGVGALVAVSVVAVVAVTVVVTDRQHAQRAAGESAAGESAAGESAAGAGGGPSPGRGVGSCAFAPLPDRLNHNDFAFDGTVAAIAARHPTDRTIPVTFTVHEWFKGGSGATRTIDLVPPNDPFVDTPAYGVGARLLVSGVYRRDGAITRLEGWACGFTRYYDEATATQWRGWID